VDKILFTYILGRRNNEHTTKETAAKCRPTKSLKNPETEPKLRVRPSQKPPTLTQDQLDNPLLCDDLESLDFITCKVPWYVYCDEGKGR
jgi:hypothetical protein